MAYKTIILTSGTTWTVPSDWTNTGSRIHLIGGGGGGRKTYSSTSRANGGGGGAYSRLENFSLTPGATVYINIGAGGVGGTTTGAGQDGTAGGDTWLNKTTNAAPTTTADGGLAKGGAGGTSAAADTAGGAAASGVGDVRYSGGSSLYQTTAGTVGASGGGSAGSQRGNGGIGGRGGTADGGGGGGGTGGSAASASSASGSNGGVTFYATAGGTGGTSTINPATAGTDGGGGGGGYDTEEAANGGDGTEFSITAGGTSGSGGGGGGTGYQAGTGENAGNGGLYGGGGGGAIGSATNPFGGNGAQGAIIISYSDTAITPGADRYWVGGDGYWNAPKNWALASGDGGNYDPPTSSNNVFFDAGSDTGADFTVTNRVVSGNCLNFTASGLDFLMTLDILATINCSGSFSSVGVSTTGTSALNMNASTSVTFNNNSGNFFAPINFANAGGTWTLSGNSLFSGAVNFQNGTLALSTYTLAINTGGTFFITISGVKALDFGTGAIELAGGGSLSVNTTGANVTTFSGSKNVNVTGTGDTTYTFDTPTASKALNVNITKTGGTFSTALTTQINNLTLAGSGYTFDGAGVVSVYGNFSISGTSLTISKGLTFAATTTVTINCGGYALTSAAFNGSGGTFQLTSDLSTTSLGTVTLTNGTLQMQGYDINAGVFLLGSGTKTLTYGGGAINITSTSNSIIFDTSANSANFTATDRGEVNIAGTGATFTVSFGSVYSSSTAPNVDFTSGTGAVTLTGRVNTLAFSGFTGSMASVLADLSFYTNVVLNAGMSSAHRLAYIGTTTGTINTNGVSVYSLDCDDVGTLQFQSAITALVSCNLLRGTIQTNNYNWTTGSFDSGNSNARTLALGSSVFTITSSGAGAFDCDPATNLTVTGTGTISLTSSSAKTFAGGGIQTWPTIDQGGSGTLTITGSNKFADITNSYSSTGATAVLFQGGSTNEFTAFNLTGTAGNICTLGSTTTTQATLEKSTAWNMGANSIDSGNNTGLTFAAGGGIDYLDVSYINGLGGGVIYASDISESANAFESIEAFLTYLAETSDTANASDTTESAQGHSGSVDESAQASETDSASQGFSGQVSETAQASETDSAIQLFGSTISEQAQAYDATASLISAFCTIAETAEALDLIASIAGIYRAIAEGATAAETTASNATFSSTSAETVNASDTDTARATFQSSASETANALDSIIGGFAYSGSISESVAVSDLLSARQTYRATISETANAQDLEAAALAFVSTVQEIVSAFDAVSAIGSFFVSLSETANSSDLISANGSLNPVVLETVQAQDQISSIGSFAITVSDSATAQDTSTSRATFISVLSESASLSDLVYGPITFPGVISETASASELVFTTQSISLSVEETAQALDSFATTAIFNIVLNEQANAADEQNAPGSVYNVSMSETVAITEEWIGNYLWNLIDDNQTPGWQNISNTQTTTWSLEQTDQSPGWDIV